MSILSGIKLVSNLATYGKLIGVGKKNGIKVYEKVVGLNGRGLTSVGRDGQVRKNIIISSNGNTHVFNKLNGEHVEIQPGSYFHMTRRSKDGAVEQYFRTDKRTFEGPEAEVIFGEGDNMLRLKTSKIENPYNSNWRSKTFYMLNKNDFNLNGTIIPQGYSVASVSSDGKTIEGIHEVLDNIPHDKNLVQSVYDSVAKLLRL